MNILLATSNSGKAKEITSFLGQNAGISFSSFADLDFEIPEKEETGETFQENALQKALHAFSHANMPVLAEDSGIQIEALKGELGIKTRRWGAGAKATDEEWMEVFLDRMKNETNRNACFFASACLIVSLEEIYIFSGKCSGQILQESKVPLQKGIPLSSYFVAEGFDKTFAELSSQEKTGISHRGKAMKQIEQILKNR